MTKPTLYLMLGYPGAGKTTVSKIIHELTGAVHLWADKIRREQFGEPTYYHSENIALYDHLNVVAAELLATGQSVIFDTNFNFYKDREKLRAVAKEHAADCVVVWVTTDKNTAKKRAVDEHPIHENRILGQIPEQAFERMTKNLQPPQNDENTLEIIGENVTRQKIKTLLGL